MKNLKDFTDLSGVKHYYKDHAAHYEKDYQNLYWQLYDALTWEFIEPYLPPLTTKNNNNQKEGNTPNILDIGCGTGKWAIKIAKRGYSVICGDISKEMIEIAQKNIINQDLSAQIKLAEMDIRNLTNLPSNTFDLIIAVGDVISYAIDDDLAVQELSRICKPGGFCIASVDNKFIYMMNLIKNEHWNEINPLLETGISTFFKEHPIKAYFVEELQDLFQRHNFEIIQLIGKPIFTGSMNKKIRERKLSTHFEDIFNLEKRFCTNPAFIGQGGHLQIICQKSKKMEKTE